MTMPGACDLALLGTIGPAIVTAVCREAARMSQSRAGREGHGQQGQLDTPAQQMNATVHFALLSVYLFMNNWIYS